MAAQLRKRNKGSQRGGGTPPSAATPDDRKPKTQQGPRPPRQPRPARTPATVARRAAAKGKRDLRPFILGGIVTAIVVALVGLLIYQDATRVDPGMSVADLGNAHIAAAEDEHEPYNTSPPTSGPHIGGGIAPAGIYEEPIVPELGVHSLEDGHVAIQYDCPEEGGCPELVTELTAVVSGYLGDNKRVILAPYSGILHPTDGTSHRIALTAWTRIAVLDAFDENRIRAFVDAYEGIDNHR